MTASTTPYEAIRKILAAVDYSNLSERALYAAIDDAIWSHGFLHVTHVATQAGSDQVRDLRVEHPIGTSEALQNLQRYVAAHLIQHAERRSLAAPMPAICHLRTGDTAREIAQLAADLEADVIYLATHGRTGFKRAILGSVAEETLRHAPCPVVVMRPSLREQRAVEDAAAASMIEPPCPECVRRRRETHGEELWCEDHLSGLGRRHVYHFTSRVGDARVNMPLVVNQERR